MKDLKQTAKYPDILYWEEPHSLNSIDAAKHKSEQHMKMLSQISVSKNKFIKNDFGDLQYWRLHVIDYCEKLLDISGFNKSLEIGAGKGMASAYLSSKDYIEKVYALDYSEASLESLMPASQNQLHGAQPNKIFRVYGSYDSIKENNFDLIYGFGALHNSRDLLKTFSSCFASLKTGGYLISSDMCLDFSVNSIDEEFLTDRVVPGSRQKYGKELTFRNTSDYFRSIVDYIYLAKIAGFRVFPIILDKRGKKRMPSTLLELEKNGGLNAFYPHGAKGRVDRLLLICRKDESVKKDINSNFNYQNIKDFKYTPQRLYRKLKRLFIWKFFN